MAKGFASDNVDFDDLFDPDVIGDGPTEWGMTSDGTALRYAALKYGAKRADVGYWVEGIGDVSNLWAARGTAVYTIAGLHGLQIWASNGAKTNATGTTGATAILYFNADGTWQARELAQGGGNNSNTLRGSGTWLDPGANVAEYEILFEHLAGDAPSGMGRYSLTSQRACSLFASVNSASANTQEKTATVKASLIRNGVTVRTATFYFGASATGWV